MFSGASPHTLDAKGRAVLPVRFRSELGESFVITRGMGGCLWVFHMRDFQRLENRLGSVSVTSKAGLALQRFFLGSAVQVTPDGQGRVLLPPLLREAAGITDEMVMVGVTNRVEIWSRAAWDRYNAEELSDANIEQMAAEFNLDLGSEPPTPLAL
ncbi:MAG TPA: division/cell wall cluster transcriptional repressor MraZ [Armatimonadota bacterium]|jgi:MraZ protein